MAAYEYRPEFAPIDICIGQGESLADLKLVFDFSLSGMTVEASAWYDNAGTTVTLDLLPSIGGAGSDEVTFALTSASTQASSGVGEWDLFVIDGASVGRRYAHGRFEIDDSASY